MTVEIGTICNAKVILMWDNGRTVEVGTISVETNKSGMKVIATHIRQRIGWELVRTGFAIMLPKRKRKEVSE